ncbi:type II toxin-antitoxin system HigB family toxin [Hymenobacter cellulosilyticus]|uniref:Type II toxin-antitoxin system HigB family toxin n=1 Tax=Hymenobacter cellulosilyticus TaxID=2932248 RepID=A0A8T9QH57_9BACT|nr:type II toxin-antitoxin system HigB family toxin [Hymenobacter cellulosilyticus]UOQ75180.1 type II toxin-antitoxin system HigB family toxin [Hymenobacter cellulosilyticus]
MNVLKQKTIRDYAIEHQDVAKEIWEVYKDMKAASWSNAADVKAYDPSATHVGNNRWVFNLLRNRYRLIVKVDYSKLPEFTGQIFIRFIGTHAEYDRISDISNL